MIHKLRQTWLIKYFIESKEEMQKVTWPSQKEVIRYSVIVIIMSLALGVYFGALDFLLQMGLEALINLVS
jgi:preprotein translocase subunit SecE